MSLIMISTYSFNTNNILYFYTECLKKKYFKEFLEKTESYFQNTFLNSKLQPKKKLVL